MSKQRDKMSEHYDELMFADGFDEAIIGASMQGGNGSPVVCYDIDKCIDILMSNDGMDYSEAAEYFEFNTINAYIGDLTPHYVIKLEDMN